jgi:hypothetical protein
MTDQTSSLSIPSKWQERFLLKRIDEKDILITLEQRNMILNSLNNGARFIQIGKYTLMLNAIKSIDPFYGEDNIPPRPKELHEITSDGDGFSKIIVNQDELDLWDKLFKDKLKLEDKND